MTNNPAIHRRPSGDVDIAVPHEITEPVADAASVTPETAAGTVAASTAADAA